MSTERLAIKLAMERSLEDQQQQQHTPHGSIPPDNNNNNNTNALSEVTPIQDDERILIVSKCRGVGLGFYGEQTTAKVFPPSSLPPPLVAQQEIGVHWVKDNCYYLGRVLCDKIDNNVLLHYIDYEDGEKEWVSLLSCGYFFYDDNGVCIVVDPPTELFSSEQYKEKQFYDDKQEDPNSAGINSSDEDNMNGSEGSEYVDDGSSFDSTDENNNISNKRHPTNRATTSEEKTRTGAKQAKRSKNSADNGDGFSTGDKKKVTFGTVVKKGKNMVGKTANRISKAVDKVKGKGKYTATGTKGIRQYTSTRDGGNPTYCCEVSIGRTTRNIGTFQTMEEAEDAMKIARDVLGIEDDSCTVPSASITGNREKAVKDMVKRVKQAIAEKGIKATKPNDWKEGMMSLPGEGNPGKYTATGTKGIRQYTSTRDGGNPTYCCEVSIGRTTRNIGTFQTMEEAEDAMKIARDVLGIEDDSCTVPSTSIIGDRDKFAKEMVKRIKEAIAKKGIKATKPTDWKEGMMSLPGEGKWIYEGKRADGSVCYKTSINFGRSQRYIGWYNTKESANKAYGLAYEELHDKDVPDDEKATQALIHRTRQVVAYGMSDTESDGKVAAAFGNCKITPSIVNALPDSKHKNQIKSLYVSDEQTFRATAVVCSSLLDKFPNLTEEILSENSDLAKEFSKENGCITDILTAKMRDYGLCSRIIPIRLLGKIDLFNLLRHAIEEFGNIFSIISSEGVPDTVSQSASDHVVKIECSSETDLLSALSHVWGVDSIKAFLTIYTSAPLFDVVVDEKENQEKVYYLTHLEMDSGCNTPIRKETNKLPSQRGDTEEESELIEVKSELIEVKSELIEVKSELIEVKSELIEVKHELIEVKRELIEGKREKAEMKHEMAEMKHEMTEMKQMMSELQSMLMSHVQPKNLVREEDQVSTI